MAGFGISKLYRNAVLQVLLRTELDVRVIRINETEETAKASLVTEENSERYQIL
jgi:hypothetical protein